MLKLILYLALTASGALASLVTPVAGAISCVLAYLLNPSAIVGEELNVRYQLLLTVAFFTGYLIHRPRRLPPISKEGRLLTLLWIFVGIGALSSTWAVVSAQQALDQIFELFKTVLMLTFVVWTIRTERQLSWLMTACLLGVGHAALAHTFGVRFGYVAASHAREFGVLPDGQTPVMVLFVPTLIVTAMMAANKWQRLLSWIILPFVLNSIVSSYMRTGFVSLGVELVMIFLALPKRVLLRVLPVLVAGVCLFLFRLAPEDYWARMSTIEAPTEEASANSRFVIASASLRMLADYPMGVGYRNYPDVSPRYLDTTFLTHGRRSAHNSFFSVACETGYLGFAVWISAFAGAIWLCRRIRKAANFSRLTQVDIYAMGIEIGLYGWLVGGLFQADHEVDPAYWFVAFTVVLIRLRFQRKVSTEGGDDQTERRGEPVAEMSAYGD